jgi:hypothetical protein
MRGRGEDAMMEYLRRELAEAERGAVVELTFHPNRTDAYNKSPDFIVDMVVTVPLFRTGPPLRVKVPLLVEVEAGAGFEAGLADLVRFVQRTRVGHPIDAPIELPFPIATESDSGSVRELVHELPIRFRAYEIAIPKRDDDATD